MATSSPPLRLRQAYCQAAQSLRGRPLAAGRLTRLPAYAYSRKTPGGEKRAAQKREASPCPPPPPTPTHGWRDG